jgi:ribonuclease P protein component
MAYEKLKLHKEFQFVYKRGKSVHSGSCVLFYLPNNGVKKIGYTATKKVGNAVVRNRCKRRLRALFSEFSHLLKDGQYVLVAKITMNEVTYDVLKRDLKKILVQAGGLISDNKKITS